MGSVCLAPHTHTHTRSRDNRSALRGGRWIKNAHKLLLLRWSSAACTTDRPAPGICTYTRARRGLCNSANKARWSHLPHRRPRDWCRHHRYQIASDTHTHLISRQCDLFIIARAHSTAICCSLSTVLGDGGDAFVHLITMCGCRGRFA